MIAPGIRLEISSGCGSDVRIRNGAESVSDGTHRASADLAHLQDLYNAINDVADPAGRTDE